MKKIFPYVNKTAFVFFIIAVNGCSTAGHTHHEANYSLEIYEDTIAQPLSSDPSLEDRILNLDPDHIDEEDIKEVISRFPAPRIINLNGSFPVVTMDSFSRFLIAMGYPEEKIRNPKNGDYSYSSYRSSKDLAGMIAWYYEKEGMMPVLIGHSQGGMIVVKVLHELAGAFSERIPAWNPFTEKSEERYFIRDPFAGDKRGIRDLKLGYSAAIGTGRLMRFFLGQWNMLTRLRKIPDTVETFTGFSIKYDLIGSDFLGFGRANRYYPLGSAAVRNVKLPAQYNHFIIPITEQLANNKITREWINRYVPTAEEPELTDQFDVNSNNILFAAEIWYDIKKYWGTELKRRIRARRRTEGHQDVLP